MKFVRSAGRLFRTPRVRSGGKSTRQVVVVELEHTLCPGDVSQAVEPEVAQRDARREAGEARFGRFRADDLAAMGRRAQASATVRRGAVVVAAP